MLCYIIGALLVASTMSAPTMLDNEWAIFKKIHNKQYTQEGEIIRHAIWESNVKMIQQHNLEADRGVHSYRLGMNHLGDMTREEIVAMLNGYKMATKKTAHSTYMAPSNVGDLPATVDWRTKGYVTPVKNQGQCGSCWAFSATGSLEGQHFKKYGKLVSLSEQNLVDCSGPEGNQGCDGGLPDQAFEYVKQSGGIDTEASYPYIGTDSTCDFSPSNVGANDTGHTDVTSGSEADLKSATATVGPISVGIDASNPTFQYYTGGVYYEPSCSSTQLDHGVLVVGYGTTTEGQDYWLVKNSWGTKFGLSGYIMMSRNRNNNCGIATAASYPLM